MSSDIKSYRAVQKKKDEEAIYQGRPEKVSEAPWLVISHDGQTVLIDILRETIRREVSGMLQEIAKEFTAYIQPVKTEPETPLDHRIIIYFYNRNYRHNSFKWNMQLDLELVEEGLIVLKHDRSLRSLNLRFAEKYGFTKRAVEQRWARLHSELRKEGLI